MPQINNGSAKRLPSCRLLKPQKTYTGGLDGVIAAKRMLNPQVHNILGVLENKQRDADKLRFAQARPSMVKVSSAHRSKLST